MSKPNYRVLLSFDGERKVFLARAPELPHCTGEGATRAEAIAKVEEEIEAQLQNMVAHGSQPPPAVDEADYSGEITVKVSKTLHRDLHWQARNEGIDVQQLASEMLAAALEARQETRGRRQGGNRVQHDHQPHDNIGNSIGNDRGGGGRPQRGYGQRYHGILDDRANFIEYVRNLEGGGGGGFGGQARGPGGGPNMHGGGRRRRRGGRGGMGGGGGNMGGGNGGGGTHGNGAPDGNGPKQA